MNRSAVRDQVAFEAVRMLPKGLFSDAVGWGARRRVPRPLRRAAYTGFARAVGANLDEVELPLEDYPNFASFFARALRDGVRPVVGDERAIACPCDGVVAQSGLSANGRMIQAKGHDYSVSGLVVDSEAADAVTGGPYVTIYLSPRDYHRVHAPTEADWLGYDFIPGTQFPVNPTWVARQPELFSRNKRVVFHLATPYGRIALVMVGATGVGNMRLVDGVETRTFRDQPRPVQVRFQAPRPLDRGAELGSFQLGSTVILLFEPGRAELDVAVGRPVRFGASIGRGVATKVGNEAA